MIDYQADKAELLRRLKDGYHGDVINQAWTQGWLHLSLFDNLDHDRHSDFEPACGCVTIVKCVGKVEKSSPDALKPLLQEIIDDPLIPPSADALATVGDLGAVLDRFIYYQEAADRLLGRSL